VKRMHLRMLVLVLLATLASCLANPGVSVLSAQLLQVKSDVSDDRGNHVTAVGYLLLTLASDIDWVSVAAQREAELWYTAETCDSRVKINGWPYLYASGGGTYSMLVAYKDVKGSLYDLASRPEDICITVGLGSMNPLSSLRSSELRYPLGDGLREALQRYASRGGQVEFQMSVDCQQRMCRPSYAKKG
jgi:hypothetical protein